MDKPNAPVRWSRWQMWIKSRRNFRNNNADVSVEKARCVAKMNGHRTRIGASAVVEINYASTIEIRSLCFAKAKWSFYNKLI